jgi:pyridoxine kinase
MEKAARILSIQSHTTHGYVGNKAATFPLQTMGYDVNCINTVSLSNHPAYKGGCKGSSLQLHDLSAFIEGLENNDLLNYDAVITGYISKVCIFILLDKNSTHIFFALLQPELLDAVSTVIGKIKDKNSAVQYVCDPVLGDNGRYYVPEGLRDVYKERY